MKQIASARRIFAGILAFFVLLLCCVGCTGTGSNGDLQSTVSLGFSSPESYSALHKTLEKNRDETARFDGLTDGVDMEVMEDAATNGSDKVSPGSGEESYSETNVQVQGIDEGDIVKTDGNQIYVLRDHQLLIFAADGKDTKLLSETTVGQEWAETKQADGSFSYSYDTPNALYLSGSRLIVLSECMTASGSEDKTLARIRIYDVSDPACPALLHTLGQDGYCTDSRLMDGVLYVFSSYSVPYETTEDEPATYVPSFYRDTDSETIRCDCILLPPEGRYNCYTVLASYDLESGKRLSETAVLDGGSTLYMSYDNLYLFRTIHEDTASEPYTEGHYSVVDYTSSTSTTISRFSVTDGVIALAASGTVDGYLINQFAADEHNSILRVVTTVEQNNYSIYSDPDYEWDNYKWGESGSSSALYTLDMDLNPVGSITGLGEDEYVYSVRFMDEIAYFVTFYQTDPLFAVDISDPAAPVLLDALKITGFSEYLHPYGDTLLFGLGMEADPETGRQENMKLTMFDIRDPAAISAVHTKQLDIDWSVARSNHKAILISAEHNLIAFPGEASYLIYGYDEAEGFSLRAEIEFGDDDWSNVYDSRGLYIDDNIYIVGGDTLFVLSMTDFTVIASLSYPA